MAGDTCSFHPTVAAGWVCSGCEKRLCPDCTASKPAGFTELHICGKCGEVAGPLKVHRSRIPFSTRVVSAPLFLLNTEGLIAVLATSVVMAVLDFAPLGKLLGIGVLWGYVFSIVRATARGAKTTEPPDFTSVVDDIIAPAVKFLIGTTLVWLPFAVFIGFNFRKPGIYPAVIFFGVVTALAGIVYGPIALMIAAAGGGALQMLNPVWVTGYMFKLGKDYAIAVVAVAVVTFFHLIFSAIGTVIATLTPIPLLPTIIAGVFGVYGPFVIGRILGLLLFTRGDEVGYGLAGDYWEPALPDAQPRAAPPLLQATTGDAIRRGEEPGRADLPAFQSIDEVFVRPIAETALEGSALTTVNEALERNSVEDALAAYEQATEFEVDALAPKDHLSLGQAAAARGKYQLAARALQAASGGPATDPDVPRALVILGRLYAERLGDPEGAQEAFTRVARQFPGTKAAEFARSRLGGGG